MAKRGSSASSPGSPPLGGRPALTGRIRGGTPRAQTLKQAEESALIVKPVKRPAAAAAAAAPNNTLMLGLGGLVVVLLVALVFVFSNHAPSVAPVASGSSQDWSDYIAEQQRQSEARLKGLIEGKASHAEVTEAESRHREATEALKAALLARLEQGAKDMAQLREELRGLADRTTAAASAASAVPIPVAVDAGREAEAERKWAQLEESVQRRVAALEQALKANNERVVPPVAQPLAKAEPIVVAVAEKKDYAWEVVAASPTYNDFDAFSKYAIKVLGVTVKKQLPGPETVLAAPFVDNRCWSFEGANGTVTLRLRERIVVGSVSLQQTKKELSFFAANAPRDFDLLDEREEPLGTFVYDGSKAEAMQTFFVSSMTSATELITFRFRTNHGSADFTCIGKISVHKK